MVPGIRRALTRKRVRPCGFAWLGRTGADNRYESVVAKQPCWCRAASPSLGLKRRYSDALRLQSGAADEEDGMVVGRIRLHRARGTAPTRSDGDDLRMDCLQRPGCSLRSQPASFYPRPGSFIYDQARFAHPGSLYADRFFGRRNVQSGAGSIVALMLPAQRLIRQSRPNARI